MINLLTNLGAKIHLDGNSIHKYGENTAIVSIFNNNINNFTAEYDFVKKMRASVLVLGPLLARFGKAKVSLPGGCAIGVRPINLHVEALKKMGAQIEIANGYIDAHVKGKLKGCEVEFPFISVGATENILSAAVLASGSTIIKNAATEPEIIHLAEFLISLGAKIKGHGTSIIEVEGVESLHPATLKIAADRVEAGTYAIAAASTNGNILLRNCNIEDFFPVKNEFDKIGIGLKSEENGVRCFKAKEPFGPCDIQTAPYPNFTTDLQAQITIPLLLADGISSITETIFENRFMHIPELMRMGADITIKGHKAIIQGNCNLQGANVMATDLRASVTLVIAGLVARSQTILDRVYHLDRGYENLPTKLSMCGADIKRLCE